MQKKWFIYAAITLLSIFAVIYYKIHHGKEVGKADAVYVGACRVIESHLPKEIKAIGTLTAKSIHISPEIPGHVKHILFKDGDFVTEKTKLIEFDQAVYKAKYESTKAQLSYSENNYGRMQLLGKQGAISKQAIDQADADLKEKQANTRESKVMLNKLVLKAPFSGVLGKATVTRGDYVTVGQSIVTLTDRKNLHIEYNVPEHYLPALKQGQVVSMTTSAYPNETFKGTLSFISPIINPDNHSVLVYAEVDNEADKLAPGMFVNITQVLSNDEKVLLIPARSLVPVLDNVQVFKVIDGKAIATNILIGRRNTDTVEVLNGLAANDIVITDGQIKLRNGDPVNVNLS